MRIERINDSTIKLFMSYQDIEQRGYNKEDLWSNRKKGEEFFWSIMDEVGSEEKDNFNFEGPLWIQVHASEKGVEVVVSKTSESDMNEIPSENDLSINDKDIEAFLNHDHKSPFGPSVEVMEEPIIIKFDNFDDIIRYTYTVDLDETRYEDLLYTHKNEYYYVVYLDDSVTFDEADGMESRLMEYGASTEVSETILNEYGTIIMSHNVRRQVRNYFQQII